MPVRSLHACANNEEIINKDIESISFQLATPNGNLDHHLAGDVR